MTLSHGPLCSEPHEIIVLLMFFEEMMSDGHSELILMSLLGESTEKEKM
jgi:hypothetical protein